MQARPVQGANPDRLDIMAQKSSPSPAARFFGNDDWDAPAEQHTPAPAAGTEDPGLSTAALEESVRPRSLDDFIIRPVFTKIHGILTPLLSDNVLPFSYFTYFFPDKIIIVTSVK